MTSWDPTAAGLRVCLRDNPGRVGVTTGRTNKIGSMLIVQVDFGPNEKVYKRLDLLEPVHQDSDLLDLLRSGAFGGPSDLRRILTFEKVKGDLTNVFYSMEASNTDFYPHQFKPVMRFIESPVGRMLIADEVGLGKTIEATYIWKEIQARHSARRLLIVCPAMLREKWRSDLRQRFNIVADIVSVRELYDRVSDLSGRSSTQSFVCITSLEGLRPPANFDDEGLQSARAKFARLLDQNVAADDFALFDHVVVDEAHYLRNPSTGNNRVGRLLREASKHLILLTATPIQIGSDNLYQLLRLIDPDQFYDAMLFREMLSANGCIVRAQRALWRQPADPDEALAEILEAEKSDYFKTDAVLDRIKTHLRAAELDAERRVEVLRLLEMRSLLAQYMTRSRKREVLPNRVERKAQTLSVAFSPAEAAIYNHVTERIRNQSVGVSGVSLFSLIARQRQMASSIVGALESWRDRELIDELLWEDLGEPDGFVDGDGDEDSVPGGRSIPVAFGYAFDIAELERTDAKYNALVEFLRGELSRNPDEKVVLFAFYRGTLKYLARRLGKDGISTAVIMGDMGDSKDQILDEFRRADGPSVLLSSEVGSEGIDLQFCRFLVNYDLPWNPMRVEQRIGRLDRLGQKAERISIINLAVSNTIEDRILIRLYDRINVFRESIGDLEEILGETTEKLMIALLDPKLSDQEREEQSAITELAIQNTQKQQRELEQEAVNLVGFSDYILDHINESRDHGRWLSAAELLTLVEDYFDRKYPGTKLEGVSGEPFILRVSLSEEARRDLGYFIGDNRPSTRTRLHQSGRPVLCNFDPRSIQTRAQDTEFVEPSHPLILWIRNSYELDQSQLYRVAAVKLAAEEVDIPRGDYAYCAQRWSFKGVREDHLLAFRAASVHDGQLLSGAQSEELVTRAARRGQAFPNAINVLDDMEEVGAAAAVCERQLTDAFADRFSDFEAENTLRCDQQEISATKFAERRIGELQQRLARYRASDNLRPVAMTEGLVRREEEQLRLKLDRISRRRVVDPTLGLLGAGVIRVE